jgi:hypothetical protein
MMLSLISGPEKMESCDHGLTPLKL